MIPKGIIRLAYLKVIDYSNDQHWDKKIWEASYKEFFMQAQQFDQAGQYKTFDEMCQNLSQAQQIPYLVSTSIIGYLRDLDKKIPELPNTIGEIWVPFTQFKFDLIDSHIEDKKQHKISIYFQSEPLLWLDTISHQMLLAFDNQLDKLKNNQSITTQLMSLPPNASIVSFQKIAF
jgi:hypothetical protein